MVDVRVTKFGGLLPPSEEELSGLKRLVESCSDIYPGIEKWYDKKVLSGLKDKERFAYLITEASIPVAACIVKKGQDAKICSFRVAAEHEQKGYGRLLMALLSKDLRSLAADVHFTIPEHIWNEWGDFFKGYGMKDCGPTNGQYRLWDQELFGTGSFSMLWHQVRRTAPNLLRDFTVNGHRLGYDIVMSLHPHFAKSIVSGTKKVEVRRRFSKKWAGSNALVYSSSPEQQFIGSFRIAQVVDGSPKEIWKTFSAEIGCSPNEYQEYTLGATKVFAIVVDNHREFLAPIMKTHLSRLVSRDFSVPQSYSKVHRDSALEEAASISSILMTTL